MRLQVAELPVTLEHMDDNKLVPSGRAEVMDVDLLGADRRDQLAGEAGEDCIRVLDRVGQRGEAAHAGEYAGRLVPLRVAVD
jgi:hypothetical protein